MNTILIVDDRPANIMLLHDILATAGYEVLTAVDGEQGHAAALEHRPDLIISDILMPHVDGFQFCHSVRATPELAHTPFIFLTGAYVNTEDEQFARELGASGFLRRPIKSRDLLDAVQETLRSTLAPEPTTPTNLNEQEYLKQHISRLTQALEDKVVELEAVTEQNTRLLNEARHKEEQLQRSLQELQETQAYLVQSERLSAVGQLVSGVAHELNNPLAIILGYTQLILRMPEASPRMTECLKKAEEGALRCQRIVHHLTIFAQRHRAEKHYLNINDVIKSVIDVRKDQIQMDQIELSTRLDTQSLIVYADYQQLQQVFLSIMNNAEEALTTRPTPGRRLEIATVLHDDTIAVQFIDNGPGISPDDRKRLFEPFFTTKGINKGVGLGLSMCYGIIKEHQGNIEVDEAPAGGAVFTVTLPLYRAASDDHDATETARHMRILIIDDEPEILEMLSLALQQGGYEIETTASGITGMERIMTDPFDLLILDIKLADSNGMTIYQHIQKDRPKLAQRTIFMTGDTSGQETQKFLEQTGNPHINKPFEIESIRKLVSRTLQTR